MQGVLGVVCVRDGHMDILHREVYRGRYSNVYNDTYTAIITHPLYTSQQLYLQVVALEFRHLCTCTTLHYTALPQFVLHCATLPCNAYTLTTLQRIYHSVWTHIYLCTAAWVLTQHTPTTVWEGIMATFLYLSLYLSLYFCMAHRHTHTHTEVGTQQPNN